jgi:hypothetical protein
MSSTRIIEHQVRALGVIHPPPEHWLTFLRTGDDTISVPEATFFRWPPESPTSSTASEAVAYGDDAGEQDNLSTSSDEHDDDDDLEDADTPLENVAAAAEFALGLLRSIDATMRTFAIAGGVAVVMRGSEQVTEDVDILYRGSMPRLYKLLLQQAR